MISNQFRPFCSEFFSRGFLPWGESRLGETVRGWARGTMAMLGQVERGHHSLAAEGPRGRLTRPPSQSQAGKLKAG